MQIHNEYGTILGKRKCYQGESLRVWLDDGSIQQYSAMIVPLGLKTNQRVKVVYHDKIPRYVCKLED